MQIAYFLRCIMLSFVACPTVPYFATLSHKRFDFRGKIFIKCVFSNRIYSNNCSTINYNNIKMCGSPPRCFGLFRPSSSRLFIIVSNYSAVFGIAYILHPVILHGRSVILKACSVFSTNFV
jgi:hypothetical protein